MPVDLTDDTTAIRARLAAATPGPWTWRGDSFDDEEDNCPHGTDWTDHGPDLETVAQSEPYPDGSRSAVKDIIHAYGYDASGIVINKADADLIAHAPADLAFLLARVETLTAALAVRARKDTTTAEWRLVCDWGVWGITHTRAEIEEAAIMWPGIIQSRWVSEWVTEELRSEK